MLALVEIIEASVAGSPGLVLSALDVVQPPLLTRCVFVLPVSHAAGREPLAASAIGAAFSALLATRAPVSGLRIRRSDPSAGGGDDSGSSGDGGWQLVSGGAPAECIVQRWPGQTAAGLVALAAAGAALPHLTAASARCSSADALLTGHATLLDDGLALGLSSHHWICDGSTHAALLAEWARCVLRLTGSAAVTPLPPFDATEAGAWWCKRPASLCGPEEAHTSLDELSAAHPELEVIFVPRHPAAALARPPPPAPARDTYVVTSRFPISRAAAAALKARVLRQVPLATTAVAADAPAWCSTSDALAALVWRCITRARLACGALAADATARLGVAVNVRSRCVPPLGGGYAGNAVLIAAVAETAAALTAGADDAALARAAYDVRAANAAISFPRVRSTVALVSAAQRAGAALVQPAFAAGAVSFSSWLAFQPPPFPSPCGAGAALLVPAGDSDGVVLHLPAAAGGGSGGSGAADGAAHSVLHVQLAAPAMRCLCADAEWQAALAARAAP